jgi:DNA-binding NarL/FixJ family response regulator
MHATKTADRVPHGTIRAAVISRHRLDCEVLSSLLTAHRGLLVCCATSDVDEALLACRKQKPDIVLLDATLVDESFAFDVTRFLRSGHAQAVLLLDHMIHHRRLSAALGRKNCGYFTRQADSDELVTGIRRLATGESAFGREVLPRLLRTSRGWLLRDGAHSGPLARLTPRELEVLRLLAEGNTVRECAEKLGIASSTVDNHKSRLMKKVGLHRTIELTRLAIREGLVSG